MLGLPLDSRIELVGVTRAELDLQCEKFSWLLTADSLSEDETRGLLASNPDFLALSAATRMNRSSVTMARGAFFPSLNASGSYGWKADGDVAVDDERAWSVTLALDLPVFTGFKNLSDYQQSKRSCLAALRRRQDLERAMVAGLRNTAASLKSRLKALDAAEKLVAQADEHLKNLSNMYEQGVASHTELADAQVRYDSSRAGCVNALYDCLALFDGVERLVGEQSIPGSGDSQ